LTWRQFVIAQRASFARIASQNALTGVPGVAPAAGGDGDEDEPADGFDLAIADAKGRLKERTGRTSFGLHEILNEMGR
jgi:hypothetical protein